MIRFTCDLCKREIDPEGDLRYVVKIEIYASLDPMVLEEDSDQIGDDVYQQLRFDLCPECRRRFLKNPLGRENAKILNFSEN